MSSKACRVLSGRAGRQFGKIHHLQKTYKRIHPRSTIPGVLFVSSLTGKRIEWHGQDDTIV
jgi:hypothetical protein